MTCITSIRTIQYREHHVHNFLFLIHFLAAVDALYICKHLRELQTREDEHYAVKTRSMAT